MKIKQLIILFTITSVVFLACTKRLDSLLDNPNYPNLSTADVDLFLNAEQLNFNTFWISTSDIAGQLARMRQWGGPFYRNAYQPNSFDFIWTTAYRDVINTANALIPLAQTQKKYKQSGIAKILKAYTLGTLVDCFGDVPYSEANLGGENLTPKADPGASVYAAVIAMLDDAIVDLTKTGSVAGPKNDLFYAGSSTKWVTLAKTLKFKFLMQTRLVDPSAAAKIQALITEDDLINTSSQDFQFQYGSNLSAPDSRHPHYAIDYVNTGGVGEYLSNYFMWVVTAQKYGGTPTLTNAAADPRARYYFYRQATNYSWANQQSAPCFVQAGPPAWYPSVPDQTPFCLIGRGYMGRDHGDASGAPPDGNFRTAWGIYPAGGKFDNNDNTTVKLGDGGGGRGINPIWLSSFTYFLKAEAANTLGIGDARALLKTGVETSIAKVLAFPATINISTPSATTPSTTQVTNYVDLVLMNYDAAPDDDKRLNVIMTEYFIGLWGNGIEPYNNYRRTGKPENAQPAAGTANPGFYMRSFFYPSVFVDRNINAPKQKSPGDKAEKVFWDNNPDNFVK
ncbi:MAG TPA: SusD/RagB family nutrient-binding outer membrane lipoprotein [Chitinophagaceae bacterium]|nr:SusD/RagB family nutrient-binding outer membrane lipoprotein [Chitinophagaceae bacterium]